MGVGSSRKAHIHAVKLTRVELGTEVYRRSGLENLQLVGLIDERFSSIQEVIAYSFTNFPSHPFLSYTTNEFSNEHLTYAQVWEMIKLFGASLGKICPEKFGELTCFGLFTENGVHWLIAELACWMCGLTVVPMDLSMSIGEVRRIVEETKMQSILCSADTYAMLSKDSKILPSLSYFITSDNLIPDENPSKIIPISSIFSASQTHRSLPKLTMDRESKHIAAIYYTRGTTGLRKGVKTLQRQIIGAIASLQNAMPIDNTDKVMSYQSLSCVFEQNLIFYAMKSGAEVHLYTQNSDITGKTNYYDSVLNAMNTQNPAIVRINSGLINCLLARIPVFEDSNPQKAPPSPLIPTSIRMFIVDIDLDSNRDSLKRLKFVLNKPILQGYGLTEAAGYVLISYAYSKDIGRVGAPAANAEVKLTPWTGKEENPRGNGLKPYELCYRTTVPFAGYVPSSPHFEEIPTKMEENGWISTGDVFYLHKTFEFEFSHRTEWPLPTNPPIYESRIRQRIRVCSGVEACWLRLISANPIRIVCFVKISENTADQWKKDELKRKSETTEVQLDQSALPSLSIDNIIVQNDQFREEMIGNIRSEAINCYGLHSYEVPLEIYFLLHTPTPEDDRLVDAWKQQRENHLSTLQTG
jgi:acyl-CoA synthetase (AMP-forming)/AMP-acid ligase II